MQNTWIFSDSPHAIRVASDISVGDRIAMDDGIAVVRSADDGQKLFGMNAVRFGTDKGDIVRAKIHPILPIKL
jgi:hypothetical protein